MSWREHAIARVLRRDRLVVVAGLAVLTLLAWLYLLQGAGMGMGALAMTRLMLFPHLAPAGGLMPALALPWSAATWLVVTAMWWVMMVAMMTPSAAPFILLYAGVWRRAAGAGRPADATAPTAILAAGYLSVWLAFSVGAAGLQWLLQQASLTSTMMMWSQSRWLSAAILIAAGLYQLSALKLACLRQCRSPLHFLAAHWRPGRAGAFRLGLRHGAFCVGCCWMLMALLFVGGIMNLVWIAGLTLFVMAEKLVPAGGALARLAGLLLLVWGAATLVV